MPRLIPSHKARSFAGKAFASATIEWDLKSLSPRVTKTLLDALREYRLAKGQAGDIIQEISLRLELPLLATGDYLILNHPTPAMVRVLLEYEGAAIALYRFKQTNTGIGYGTGWIRQQFSDLRKVLEGKQLSYWDFESEYLPSDIREQLLASIEPWVHARRDLAIRFVEEGHSIPFTYKGGNT